MTNSPSVFRLLLWPSVITLLVSTARLVAEVQGWRNNQSGGAGELLGITWCIFVFGAWFGRRLSAAGSLPRVPRAWLWPLLGLLATAGIIVYGFRPLLTADRSEATFQLVRQAVMIDLAVAIPCALAMFVVWPRLAWTLLLYGLGARLTVVAFTWLAKHQGWNTHYTKFGPPGIERDSMSETMTAACVAQLGGWIAITLLGGTLAGVLFAKRAR